MNRAFLILAISMVFSLTLLNTTFPSLEAQSYPEIKQLTRNDLPDSIGSGRYSQDHVLSWDGSKLVFSTWFSTSPPYDVKVYVMNTSDGPGEEKLMTDAQGVNNHASISADGSKIVFGSTRTDPSDPWYSYEIFVMRTSDSPSDEIRVTNDGCIDHNPDISGNGDIIAWHSSDYEPTGWDILIANISNFDDIEPIPLVTGSHDVFYPSLTYDGESMVFWDRNIEDVMFINTNGTGLKNVSASPEYEHSANSISADGSKVAFQRRVGIDYEIFVYDLIDDALTQLTENDADDWLGCISGDGRIVTYSRNGHIFIHNMITETQLTNGDSDDKYPRISGDGTIVVFESNRDGPDYDIFMICLQEQVAASIDINPETLNLKSQGQWITAYIELPEDYDVTDINVSSILVNDTIPVDLTAPTSIGDHDGDGVPDLMVKFDRATVVQYMISQGIEFTSVTMTLTGQLYDGPKFEGNDTIRVSGLIGDVNCDGKVNLFDIVLGACAYGSRPGSSRWNDNANFAQPWDIINLADIVKIACNYGKKYP